MTFHARSVPVLVLVALMLAAAAGSAHHAKLAKFDETKPITLSGIVTHVDWRNPHVHVFMNVRDEKNEVRNWAIELASPIMLEQSGWTPESLRPGDAISIEGLVARNGSRQASGDSVVLDGTQRRVLYVKDMAPALPLSPRPTPRWSDNQPRLGGEEGGVQGYWAYPSSTVLVENGVEVEMSPDGILANLADASKVAPMQPWAEGIFRLRQSRSLRDDPMFLNCKPPGGPRQFQLPQGVQLVEDRARQRVFVLIGGGNNNFRIMYLDGRPHQGQVGGDDNNPLYYGRSVGKWEGDTLVVETRGFNEDFWFTNGGLPHTELLRLVERFSRPDFDTLRYDVTIDDPGAYTRSWDAGWTLRWVAEEMPRHLCQENRP